MESLELPNEEIASPITKEQALQTIAEIRQRVALMGANDSEFFDLDQIVKRINDGSTNPEQAITEAHMLLNGKQDYH